MSVRVILNSHAWWLPQFLLFSTAVYDVRASWLSSTSAQFQFHQHKSIKFSSIRTEFHQHSSSIIKSLSSTEPRVPISSTQKSSSTEFLHNIIIKIVKSTGLVFSHRLEIQCESVADSADFFSYLGGNYLAPNLTKLWVPRNSAHSQS